MPSVVIIGGGQAGLEAAAALRTQKFAGAITLICEEPHPPYQRPPLSKDYLLGKQDADTLSLRALAYYETHHIDVRLATLATRIDRENKTVHLDQGGTLSYDFLILAVGARNRPLQVPGAQRALYLRTLDQARALRERISEVDSVAVIGGGFIGLEVAAAARSHNKQVTVIEAGPRLMARAVSPVLSDFFLKLHSSQGVNVVLEAAVASIDENSVTTAGGRIPADLVVAGIGVIPNTELAASAGLAPNPSAASGILVDEFLRTSDPAIFAIGDCAAHPNVFAPDLIRLESVQNAVDQAKCAARAILGAPTPYRDVPWFWTDQYEVRFQMVGLPAGHDQQILRGSIEQRKFSVFYLRAGKLIAADSVNRFGDHIGARKLLAQGVSPTAAQLADENLDLKKLTLQKSPS